MSVGCMTWVFDHSRSKGTDRLVLLVLADHASKEDWTCYPSVYRIAHMANSSETAVHRSLRNLVALGEIAVSKQGAWDERIRKDRRPNLYRFVANDGVPHTAPGVESGVPPASSRGAKTVDHGVPLAAPKPKDEPSKNRDENCSLCEGAGFLFAEGHIPMVCDACS